MSLVYVSSGAWVDHTKIVTVVVEVWPDRQALPPQDKYRICVIMTAGGPAWAVNLTRDAALGLLDRLGYKTFAAEMLRCAAPGVGDSGKPY